MSAHIVPSYDKELQSTIDAIEEMVELNMRMLASIQDQIKSDGKSDNRHLKIVEETDAHINTLEHFIEKQVVSTIALRQPMAVDLRMLTASLKMGVILERMGDLVKNTIKRLVTFNVTVPDPFNSQMLSMTTHANQMLADMRDAFRDIDVAKAKKVCDLDDDIDDIYSAMISDIEHEMEKNPKDIPHLLQILFCVKNLERFADYITKCAKNIYYIESGKRPPKTW